MVLSIIALILVLIGLFALALQRFYSCVPAKELKRLAARGDHLAVALYQPVAYGESMRLLLWIVFVASLTGGFVLFSNALVAPAAYVVVGLSLALALLVQSMRLTVHSARLAVKVAPALNWLLVRIHAPFDVAGRLFNHRRTRESHSGLYEKEDLVALLEQQKGQPDNRISRHDLELLTRAAQFDDRQAADVVTPMSRLKLVNADDHLGPILLGELHKSGQTSFLVYKDTADNIVGTLFLHDAVAAREGGLVADIVRAHLSFVHEDFSLQQALGAFIRSGQYMLVVVNSFEEMVGAISLQQLLSELLGEQVGADEIAPYEDRAAIAAFKPEHAAAEETAESVDVAPDASAESDASSPESTEMVE